MGNAGGRRPRYTLLMSLVAWALSGGALCAANTKMEVLLHEILRSCVLMGCMWSLCLPLQVVEECLQSVWGRPRVRRPASDAISMAWRSGKITGERGRLFSTTALRADSRRVPSSMVL